MKTEATAENSVTLTEEIISFGGMLLKYSLIASNTYVDRFRIRVMLGDERAEYGTGNDIDLALKRYRAVVRGRVTPCGLSDVMYDLCREA